MHTIVSDFDGVLTDQTQEAQRAMTLFKGKVAASATQGRITPNSLQKLMDRVDSEMTLTPWKHGWWIQGMLSAFCDEDLFIKMNGTAGCLDQLADQGDPVAIAVRGSLTCPNKRFTETAFEAFTEMTQETKQGKHKPLDTEGTNFLKKQVAAGHRVVIVSNSSTDRIEKILQSAGLQASAFREGMDLGKPGLFVRGDAKKFEVDKGGIPLSVGNYSILTDRPGYRKIITDENPVAVIGDVFSLDLALPWTLNKDRSMPIQLFLRKRPYTPAWTSNLSAPFFRHAESLEIIGEKIGEEIGVRTTRFSDAPLAAGAS